VRAVSAPIVARTLRHVLLTGSSTVVLVPFIIMLTFAFSMPSWTGSRFAGLSNFSRALAVVPFGRFLGNGAIVAISVCALQILIAAPCAYALAKLTFRGRDIFFALVTLSLLVPQQVLALPLFLLLNRVGLLDSYTALILPFTPSPFAIFLFRQVFKAIPDDIVNAARLDGLSEWAIVWRVMLPMAAPSVAAFSILSMVSRWNDLFWPSIAVTSERLMPPTLGILFFRNDEAGDEYGPLMAATMIVVLPLIAWFLAAQRRFVEGLSLGAVK
jgi:multiple sugar transport system permease protein